MAEAARGKKVAFITVSVGGNDLAALTPNDPAWQPDFEEADTSVVAAVPVYGRYDWHSTNSRTRRDFIGFLEKFVVKKSFTENRQVYLDASSITPCALSCSATSWT